MVGNQVHQVCVLSVAGSGGGALTEIEITASPGLSMVRIDNRSSLKTVAVKAFSINQTTNTPVNRERKDIRVPKNHDLIVAVSDWDRLDLNTEAVSL